MSGVEAFVHTLLAVLRARLLGPEIVHLHAIGAGYAVACARMLGLRVVFTHHGLDYQREKWGPFARLILRGGEFLAIRFASQLIFVSNAVAADVERRLGRGGTVIWNGVREPDSTADDLVLLGQWGLASKRYILQVSRTVPEKRQLDLIESFAAAELPGWHLVLVGAIDGLPYARAVQARAAKTPGIVLAGFQSGAALTTLYVNAGFFVLPSSLEGLPIALLEALSHGLPVIASDIAANREIGLEERHYFPLGDIPSLTRHLERFAAEPPDPSRAEEVKRWALERFSWSAAAQKTMEVYHLALGRNA